MRKVLDLSQHNGAIDFAKVKNAGINDLILRVGWIGNRKNHTIDTRFHEYYTIAKANGFRIGIYVYSYCTSLATLKDGMIWVYNQIKNLHIDLPVFLDLEDGQIAPLSKNELTTQAIEFCNYFKSKGYLSGVYASKSWFMNKLNVGSLLNFKIWLAEWNGKENHTASFRVDLWQYTSKGKVDGINSNVDISKCLECEPIKEEYKPEVKSDNIKEIQEWLNDTYGFNLDINGKADNLLKEAIVIAWKTQCNKNWNAKFLSDNYGRVQSGSFGDNSKEIAKRVIREKNNGGKMVKIIQALCWFYGYNNNSFSGNYGNGTVEDVHNFKIQHGLSEAGTIVGEGFWNKTLI